MLIINISRYHVAMGSLNLTSPEDEVFLPMNLLTSNNSSTATNSFPPPTYEECFENNNSIIFPHCNCSLLCNGTYVGGECIVSYHDRSFFFFLKFKILNIQYANWKENYVPLYDYKYCFVGMWLIIETVLLLLKRTFFLQNINMCFSLHKSCFKIFQSFIYIAALKADKLGRDAKLSKSSENWDLLYLHQFGSVIEFQILLKSFYCHQLVRQTSWFS